MSESPIGVVGVSVYTLGIWTVKDGCEDKFIAAWRDIGVKTRSDFPGLTARLLRDRETPNRFISSGPWESLEQIEAWRASPTFVDGFEKIRDLIDAFEPHTMDESAVIG